MSQIIRDLTEVSRCGAQYRLDKLAPMGLKACHASYLLEISAHPGISQDKLAARICINKSNVARQAAALEEGGFIERRTCGKDKRVMRLYPTQKTLDLLPEIDRIMASWQTMLTQDLTEDEQLLLERMLGQLLRRASGYMEDKT